MEDGNSERIWPMGGDGYGNNNDALNPYLVWLSTYDENCLLGLPFASPTPCDRRHGGGGGDTGDAGSFTRPPAVATLSKCNRSQSSLDKRMSASSPTARTQNGT